MSNIYARVTALKSSSGGVKGRLEYISDPERQEQIYDFHSTVSMEIWQQLSAERKQDNKSSGQFENCIEAKEITLALPHEYFEKNRENMAEKLAGDFEETYHVPCAVAIHVKKQGKNIHAHIVFSESELLPDPEIKIASRNMFYDENGKHCRTKKDILGDDGKVREGCKIVKKGEVYKTKYFKGKRDDLKANNNAHTFKEHYSKLLDLDIYSKDQGKLKQFKVGKGNPNAEAIKSYNAEVQKFNKDVEVVVNSGAAEKKQLQMLSDGVRTYMSTLPIERLAESLNSMRKKFRKQFEGEIPFDTESALKSKNMPSEGVLQPKFNVNLSRERQTANTQPVQPKFNKGKGFDREL